MFSSPSGFFQQSFQFIQHLPQKSVAPPPEVFIGESIPASSGSSPGHGASAFQDGGEDRYEGRAFGPVSS